MSHLDEGLLHALLDGEIPSAELPPIQSHLAACAACRARLEEERQLLVESDGLVEALELPAGGEAPVGGHRSRQARRAWGRNLAWAASLLAAVGLGYAGRGLLKPPPRREVATTAPAASPDTAAARNRSGAEPATPPAPAPSALDAVAPGAAAPGGRVISRRPPAKAAELKQEIAAATESRPDTAGHRREAQPAPVTPPPVAAEAAAAQSLRDAPLRMDERRANPALNLGAAKLALAPAEPILLPDAIRRLGGSLRLIDGLVPLRLEAQGPYVRVVYPLAHGELVLQQQLIDGRVVHTLLAPPGFPTDSLARLRARVRE